MIESSSESESVSVSAPAGGGGSTGGGGATGGGGSTVSPVSFLVSSLVSPLFPLSIKVRRGNGDVPVMRVGLLLLVFAETGVGVLSSDIQAVVFNVGASPRFQSFRM